MTGKAIILALVAALGACNMPAQTSEPELTAKIDNGAVALFAVAPDGTKLWAVRGNNGRTVYFAATGASTTYTEYCGKNCTRVIDDQTPTVESH